jgi:acyl carrier protein
MQSSEQKSTVALDAIAEQVVSLIASVKKMSREGISLDSNFHELGLDSLDTVVLLSELEDHFKIFISNDEARSIVHVRDAVERIQQLKGVLSCDAVPPAQAKV